MGCGCKGKKKRMTTASKRAGEPLANSVDEIDGRRKTVKETKEYQNKVRDALRHLMEIKKKKQNLRN